MQSVSLLQTPDYELVTLKRNLIKLMEPLGSMSAFITPGERVLIKPNLLAAKYPEKAVTTHPALVQVVAELVQEAGGIVLIGDSPGIGGFQKVAQKSGIAAAAEACGATLVEFTKSVELNATGMFRRIHLAHAYLEADKIINLPKLKTHEMMTMTCAVKNLFGAVVGTEKAAWHLKAGASRELFAKLLLEIYLIKKPALNIVDAVVAMEGNGPGSGDPVHLGLLIAGVNPVAVDVVAGRLAGLPPDLLPVEREAERMHLPGSRLEDITIYGPVLDTLTGARFRLPDGLDVQFGLPNFLKKVLKRNLLAFPAADNKICVLCGACRDACPPTAITIQNSALSVDKARCIRCWCCRELCPHSAMVVKLGLLLTALTTLAGRKRL
jgi:uncharacterized protein (DUF362 family)/Pyruvate/2-oxoacid:ferredoxin oxidoreductase delta subunit